MLEVGTLLEDKYEILKEISRNNLSAVYLAINVRANKQWAIKEIYKGTSPQQTLAAKREVLCRLSHPNLPQIVDIIEEENSYIVIHDYIQGDTLDDVLSKTGFLSQESAISIAKQICDALQYLHSRTEGVFCGNISPSKITLKPDGNIVLTDYFWTTKYDNANLTDTTCLGTKGYSAPEQFGGVSSVDARTDIYCLGAILYSLVTGKNLNESPYEIRPIREFNEDFSSGLEDVIQKCTQLPPEDRYQSASELMYALESYQCLKLYSRNRRGKIIEELLHPLKNFSKAKTKRKKNVDSIKDVRFSALAPKDFLKGEYTIVEIAMYEDEYKNLAIQSKTKDEISEISTGYFQIADRTQVSICLTSPDVEIAENTETLTWCGKYLNFQFAVYLPEDSPKKQLLFNATVYFNNVIATKIKFVAKCSSLREQKMKVIRDDVLSAFISYASQDRNRVALIIQGMRKSRPDMEIFFDVDALRSGENWEKTLMKEIETRDVLFLCWSQFAKESKWVDTEWRYALSNKGIDSIEPIPLEPPTVCPPPKELESKHFNDRELYYRTMQ